MKKQTRTKYVQKWHTKKISEKKTVNVPTKKIVKKFVMQNKRVPVEKIIWEEREIVDK